MLLVVGYFCCFGEPAAAVVGLLGPILASRLAIALSLGICGYLVLVLFWMSTVSTVAGARRCCCCRERGAKLAGWLVKEK